MAQNQRKIKWGILGYARIARKSLIPAILKASNSECYAVATRNPEKKEEAKKSGHFQKIYSDYESVLNDPDVDAVYIPLPNHLHREWAIRAAGKGKHVLCEKPLALTVKECEEMAEAAWKNQVKLMEAFMYSYSGRTAKILEIIRSGQIGEIRNIYAEFRFFLDRPDDFRFIREMGGGALYDVGCYPVNLLGLILNDFPETVCGIKTLQKGVDVNFSGSLSYKNGVIAGISCGFNSTFRSYAEISGTGGTLEILNPFQISSEPLILTTDKGKKSIKIPATENYRLEVEDFANAVLTEKEPSHNTIAESIRNMGVLEKLIRL